MSNKAQFALWGKPGVPIICRQGGCYTEVTGKAGLTVYLVSACYLIIRREEIVIY